MRTLISLVLSVGIGILVGCAVKTPVIGEYQLSAYSTKQYVAKPRATSLLVTAPEAAAGYQTERMLYMKKPFEVQAYVKNAWISPPADMLYPLLAQSLQKAGYFHAVASSSQEAVTDYRLDTQLLVLKQNFLTTPSVIELAVKVVITRVDDNKVLASRVIKQQVPCPMDTPYGGVIAANTATYQLTAAVVDFVDWALKYR